MAAPRKTIHIGVFIPTECQLLDAACIDVLGSMSYEYLSPLQGMAPQELVDAAPSTIIHYIGGVKAGEHISLTSSEKILATNHYNDPEVAPGKLDIVIVPGPNPATKFEEGALNWLGQQGANQSTDILSVCTGIFLCGYAGLLKGKKNVCGPRGFQDMLKDKFGGDIVQRGHELRWVQDGNLWSSGGVTNGNDLVAAYARAKSDIWPRNLVELCLALVEVGDRGQLYETPDVPQFQSLPSLA